MVVTASQRIVLYRKDSADQAPVTAVFSKGEKQASLRRIIDFGRNSKHIFCEKSGKKSLPGSFYPSRDPEGNKKGRPVAKTRRPVVYFGIVAPGYSLLNELPLLGVFTGVDFARRLASLTA